MISERIKKVIAFILVSTLFYLNMSMDARAEMTASDVIAAFDKPDIILSWIHAAEREDGSPLSLDEIDGYRIYYSVNSGEEIAISVPRTTSFTLADVDSGSYSFQIATVSQGVEGRRSPAVAVSIASASPLFPVLRVTLELCNSSGDCVSEVVQ